MDDDDDDDGRDFFRFLEGEDDDDNADDDLALPESREDATKPRYYCAGAIRRDDEGRRFCTYRARYPWAGRCPGNPDRVSGPAREEVLAAIAAGKGCSGYYDCKPIKKKKHNKRHRMSLEDLSSIPDIEYHSTGFQEVDAVLGGGLVFGKVVLLGGKRGNGKTRLVLQIAGHFATADRKTYFASGEDARLDVAQFAKQLGAINKHVEIFGDPGGIDIDLLLQDVTDYGAKLVIVDSLQVCGREEVKADVGQVAQIDVVLNRVSSYAKQKRVAFIVIGQLNKEGDYGGSEKGQHTVDALLRFDPEPIYDEEGEPIEGGENVRKIWLDGKSRQGRTDIVSYLEMSPEGRLVSLSDRLRRRMSRLKLV